MDSMNENAKLKDQSERTIKQQEDECEEIEIYWGGGEKKEKKVEEKKGTTSGHHRKHVQKSRENKFNELRNIYTNQKFEKVPKRPFPSEKSHELANNYPKTQTNSHLMKVRTKTLNKQTLPEQIKSGTQERYAQFENKFDNSSNDLLSYTKAEDSHMIDVFQTIQPSRKTGSKMEKAKNPIIETVTIKGEVLLNREQIQTKKKYTSPHLKTETENVVDRLKREQRFSRKNQGNSGTSSFKKGQPMVKEVRDRELEKTKSILSGKVSIIWIFVINEEIDEDSINRIKAMYGSLTSQKYITPILKKAIEIKQFLDIPNSLFKIVSDLDNIEEALRFKIHKTIVEYYIFNEKGENGIAEALEFKHQSKKVKAIFTNLSKIIDRAEDQIDNEILLYMKKSGLAKRKHMRFFPSFLKLSGEDKTQATNYRFNLFGARNLPISQKKAALENFMDLVQSKYGQIERQTKNISQYMRINHFQHIENRDQAKEIVKFYTRQSFYYDVLNSLLRTMKTTQEFKPCILPFNETYHSIRLMHQESNGEQLTKQVLYRGTKLRKKDFEKLHPGVYIQMFGFMSTSKNFEAAKNFIGDEGYMFLIHIPQKKIPKKYIDYNHGFVDINKFNLQEKAELEEEEEVLFNALNVFKVMSIRKDKKNGLTLIDLEYGVIFDLLNKKKRELTPDQNDVLVNYQYCIEMLSNIQDQGDVHLYANEFSQSKEYYENYLASDENNGKILYKLANVQQKCGQLEDADKNAKKSLEIQLDKLDKNDREKCMIVFSVHKKNAEISLEKEDYLSADDNLTQAIQMLPEGEEFEKAKKLRERGEIKFKKGQIVNAEKDFQKSEKLFEQITQKANEERKRIKKNYFFSYLTVCCTSNTLQQIEEQRQEQLQKISDLEQQILKIKDSICDELVKVNHSLKQVAQYAEDKEKYQICVKKARSYLLEIQSRETNDPHEKARFKAMQATLKDYLELAQSQKLLNQAISIIQSTDQNHQSVGQYSEILAKLQKQNLEKFTNPKCQIKAVLRKDEKINYNQNEHQEVYEKCKKNYQRAINVLLYHSKSHASPEVMSLKNQLGELQYNEKNYESSQQIIKQVRKASQKHQHTEISKSSLLLAKIAYSRGELKYAFININDSQEMLQQTIVKKQEQKYLKIYRINQIYLESLFYQSKIYLKQLDHDLCLKSLGVLKQSLSLKLLQQEYHELLADSYELEAQTLASRQRLTEYDRYFQKALDLRRKQIGTYNIGNAVTHCNYAKYLLFSQDIQAAIKQLQKAAEIFSCFSSDHPIVWLLLYCYGVLKIEQNQNEEALSNMSKCLKLAKRKFDQSHITLSKIRLQYAKRLQNQERIEEAIEQLQKLQNQLSENIKASQNRRKLEEEKDDEKITIQKKVYESLQIFYSKTNDSNVSRSRKGIDYCKNKIEQLRQTYHLS